MNTDEFPMHSRQSAKLSITSLHLDTERSTGVVSSTEVIPSQNERIPQRKMRKQTTKYLAKLVERQISKIQEKEYGITNPYYELIDEIKKGISKENSLRHSAKRGEFTSRDTLKIMFLLKKLPGFQKFMSYYNIDDESVKVAALYIAHRRCPKGTNVFKQGDKSDNFYGIIGGRVSIREYQIEKRVVKEEGVADQYFQDLKIFQGQVIQERAKHYTLREVKELVEVEKFQLGPGQCFGEWGLIYKRERTSSVYCLEDTDLFSLNSFAFELSFSKCMTKAEFDRKHMLMKTFPFFAQINKPRFDSIYKDFIGKFFNKGEYVYKEGDIADTIYIIYQGQCIIEKNILVSSHNDDSRVKNISLLVIEKGDTSGLEAFDFDPEEKIYLNGQEQPPYSKLPKYIYSLKAFSQTIAISIRMSKLKDTRKDFISCFKELRGKKESILEEILNKKIRLKKKIEYRESRIKKVLDKTGTMTTSEGINDKRRLELIGLSSLKSKIKSFRIEKLQSNILLVDNKIQRKFNLINSVILDENKAKTNRTNTDQRNNLDEEYLILNRTIQNNQKTERRKNKLDKLGFNYEHKFVGIKMFSDAKVKHHDMIIPQETTADASHNWMFHTSPSLSGTIPNIPSHCITNTFSVDQVEDTNKLMLRQAKTRIYPITVKKPLDKGLCLGDYININLDHWKKTLRGMTYDSGKYTMPLITLSPR